MDNIVTPSVSPNLNLTPNDKLVQGELVLPQGSNLVLKPQESILLSILNSSDSKAGSLLNTEFLVHITNPQGEVVTHSSLPLTLKLNLPLQLPLQQNNVITAKTLQVTDQKVNLRLTAVNNEAVGTYLTKDIGNNYHALSVPNPHNHIATKPNNFNRPVIMPSATIDNQVAFHPLELSDFVAKIATQENMPLPLKETLVTALKTAKLKFNLQEVIDNNAVVRQKSFSDPLSQSLAEANQSLNNVIDRVRFIINNFTEKNFRFPEVAPDVQDLVANIKQEFFSLRNVPVVGEAVTLHAQKVIAVQTPLGNVLLEKPLNINDDSRFVLNIEPAQMTEVPADTRLKDLLPTQKLTENMLALRPLLNLFSKPAQPSDTIQKLVELLTPMSKLGSQGAVLSAKVMAKLPGINNHLLSNMVSFVKGAMHQNITEWLGKELTEEIINQGSEGKEVINRLHNFMASNSREGVSWRMVEIPFVDGNNLAKIRLAVKKYTDDEAKSHSDNLRRYGTRFVVDTNFSVLGEFQFDGFSLAQDKRFDLIVRTSKPLTEDFYNNIMRIFTTTMHEVDYSGTIKINVKENFIKICEDENDAILKDGIYI